MFRRILIVVASCILSLLALELALRLRDAVVGNGFFSDHRNELAHHPRAHPFRGFGPRLYRTREGERQILSRWKEPYPFEKPEGTFRIVCFGGSASANKYAQALEGIHYPGVLQQVLREELGTDAVEVISVASSAFATPHSLTILSLDVLSWDPDLVILSHNINDLQSGYMPAFKPDYSHKYRHHVPTLTPPVADILFQHSNLYWLLKKKLRALDDNAATLEAVPAEEVDRRSYGLAPPAEPLEVYRRNLRSFVRLARAEGVEVVLATQPFDASEAAFLRSFGLRTYVELARYPLHEEFVAHHRAYDEALLRIAAEEGARGFDVAAKFTAPGLLHDCVHLTPDGVRHLARAHAAHLTEAGLIGAR